MRSTKMAQMAVSAVRRSALALLTGFWLALVIWTPSNGDLLVLQSKNLKLVDDNGLRGTNSAFAGNFPQQNKSLIAKHVITDVDIARLRRRALPLTEHGQENSSERHRIGEPTSFRRRKPTQDNRRDDSTRIAPRKVKDDILRVRDALQAQISTTRVLLDKTHDEAGRYTGKPKQFVREVNLTQERSDEESSDSNILDEVFISVKTTKTNHRTRLPPILQTWFQLARNQTYFFSDTDDGEIARASGGHLVVTGCPIGHSRRALSCKMNSEFDVFAASNRSQKKWWCHFDDDNYVNVPALGKVLRRYDSSRVWYLGRNSIMRPIDLNTKDWGSVRFRFATGGAGFCISRALSDALVPYAFAGRLAQLSDRIRLPDDVTVGFLVEVIVGAKLTVVPGFHSHLEEMKLLEGPLKDQISLSYMKKRKNFVGLEQRLPNDPTRFISIHCVLFPSEHLCTRLQAKHSN